MVKLGTPCVINIRTGTNSVKWGTTHPNKEPGKLTEYLMDLSSRWIVGSPVGNIVTLTRREV